MTRKYDRLLQYISYFEDHSRNFCVWVAQKDGLNDGQTEAYPEYDKKLKDFVDEVHKTGIMETDFREFLLNHIPIGTEVIDAVENADLYTTAAILAYFIEIEDYMPGIWEEAAQDGTFLKILKRIRELV